MLTASLEAGRTGCLTASDAGLGVLQVYVMGCELLAAHAEDDEVQLLRCLRASELLPVAELDGLTEACTSPGQFMDALYDVLDDEAVQLLMQERFRENLFRFLVAAKAIDFEPMDAVFVSNIQIGHDSRALLDELTTQRDRTRPVERSRVPLLPGTGGTTGDHQARVLKLCSKGIAVSELLRRAAREPNRVLQDVADMLDSGVLIWDSEPSTPVPPAQPTVGFELPAEDEHTDDGTPSPAAEAPEAALAPGVAEDRDDAYMDAFGDYDTIRGDGSFSGVRDVVELEAHRDPPPDVEPDAPRQVVALPEADAGSAAGAVSLNFSGPRLADDDARSKLEVVNEVLEAVRAAIDTISGTGTGQSRVQLVVDGSSATFAALFSGVELRVDGRLPVEQVLKNLRKRPVTEHRRLLQRASTDLIERALSLASEDLDDTLMEQVLEKVAGYQQRLGI